MLKTIFLVLSGAFESCFDTPALTVRPLGALILICACILHVACLIIFYVVGPGLGATCYFGLGVACFACLSKTLRIVLRGFEML